MKSKGISKNLLIAILTGSYTRYDEREFVHLCYNLALPLIRKKIAAGKLRLTTLWMTEDNVLYDCLADLFERNEHEELVQLKNYFVRENIDATSCSEEFLLDSLRRLIFSRVNASLVRIYSEADPLLGKILHNMDVALDRTKILLKVIRFGDSYLIPLNEDVLLQQPPMPIEYVRTRFFRVTAPNDSMPVKLKKLHDILLEQNEYQRVVSFVSGGLLFKEVHLLTRPMEVAWNAGEDNALYADIQNAIENVCRDFHRKFFPKYVKKNKTTEELFNNYIAAIKRILNDEFAEGIKNSSLFEALRDLLPGLTKQEYAKRHRSVLEYLLKNARKQLRKKLSA